MYKRQEPPSYGVGGVDLVEYDEATGGPSEDKEIPSLDLENAVMKMQ